MAAGAFVLSEGVLPAFYTVHMPVLLAAGHTNGSAEIPTPAPAAEVVHDQAVETLPQFRYTLQDLLGDQLQLVSLATKQQLPFCDLLLPLRSFVDTLLGMGVKLGGGHDEGVAVFGVIGTEVLDMEVLDGDSAERSGALGGTLVLVVLDPADALEAEGLGAGSLAGLHVLDQFVADEALEVLQLGAVGDVALGHEQGFSHLFIMLCIIMVRRSLRQ